MADFEKMALVLKDTGDFGSTLIITNMGSVSCETRTQFVMCYLKPEQMRQLRDWLIALDLGEH